MVVWVLVTLDCVRLITVTWVLMMAALKESGQSHGGLRSSGLSWHLERLEPEPSLPPSWTRPASPKT